MAIVLLSCADCGPVDIDAAEVVLETIRKVYQFRCPNCTRLNRESAAASVVELLVRAGVRIRPWPMKDDGDIPVQTQSDPVERPGP
jgi:hypothetical protein